MNTIFKHEIVKIVLIYLDSIISFSKTKEQHIVDLNKALNILRFDNLFAKKSKCKFFKLSLNFLGNDISDCGISHNLEKFWAINNLPQPTDVKQLWLFLGLIAISASSSPGALN